MRYLPAIMKTWPRRPLILIASASMAASVLHADDASPPVTEADLSQTWGQTNGRMECGNEVVLFFPRATITLSNGRVSECRIRDLELERKEAEEAVRERDRRLALAKAEAETAAHERAIAEARAEEEKARAMTALASTPTYQSLQATMSAVTSSCYSAPTGFGFGTSSGRACVTQQNLAGVQSGEVVVVPNLDPATGTWKSCQPQYVAVKRETFQTYGGTLAAQYAPPSTCQAHCAPACPPPHCTTASGGIKVKIKL